MRRFKKKLFSNTYELYENSIASLDIVRKTISAFDTPYLLMSIMALDDNCSFLDSIEEKTNYKIQIPEVTSLISETILFSKTRNIEVLIEKAFSTCPRSICFYGFDYEIKDFKYYNLYTYSSVLVESGVIEYELYVDFDEPTTRILLGKRSYNDKTVYQVEKIFNV